MHKEERKNHEYRLMDCAGDLGSRFYFLRMDEGVPVLKSKDVLALGQRGFEKIGFLYWDCGIVWRLRDHCASSYEYCTCIDANCRNRPHMSS